MGRDLYEAGYPLSAQPKKQSQPLWADESPWEAPSCRESTDAFSLCAVLLRNRHRASTRGKQPRLVGRQICVVPWSTREGWAPFCSSLSLSWAAVCTAAGEVHMESQLRRFTASLLLEALCALDPNECLPIHFPHSLRMAMSDCLLLTGCWGNLINSTCQHVLEPLRWAWPRAP